LNNRFSLNEILELDKLLIFFVFAVNHIILKNLSNISKVIY